MEQTWGRFGPALGSNGLAERVQVGGQAGNSPPDVICQLASLAGHEDGLCGER
jgi:hypothetical protein